jgi:hypothetical protein
MMGPMKVLLYTLEPPQGRCLLLAQELHMTSNIPVSECVQIAERLFANHHPRTNPVILDIPDAESASRFEVTCAGLGILIESTEHQESVIPG